MGYISGAHGLCSAFPIVVSVTYREGIIIDIRIQTCCTDLYMFLKPQSELGFLWFYSIIYTSVASVLLNCVNLILKLNFDVVLFAIFF